MNTVEEYYNTQYDEWGRLERHRIEFELTKRVLDEYIEDGSDVLDVGGGPGRYSIYLLQKNCKVTLVDLSEMLVKQALSNATNAGVKLQQAIQGNALELDTLLPGRQFNAVLCMGPMYHLLAEAERKQVIRHCTNLLKPGGIIVVSFISAYAPIIDCMREYPNEIGIRKESFLRFLTDGRSYNDYKSFTDAYFIDPENIEQLLSGFSLEKLSIIATEGLGAPCEDKLMKLPEAEFQEWMDLFYQIAGNRVIWGSSEHLLYAGRKEL